MESNFFYYSVPKKEPLVYLVCETNLENGLLPGQLNIHLGGRFVGRTFLGEKKAGQELLINLGASHDIKIQYEKITSQLAESFLGGMMDRLSIIHQLEFRIVIENLQDKEARVKIMDAIPVSITDRIQVKDIDIQPEATVKDWRQQKGVMEWDMNIATKETKEIHIKFFIKHPKDCMVELETS